MAGSSERRRGRGGNLDVWPGYVDALSTLLMVIIFVLLVFVLAQGFLSVALSSREKAMDQLNRRVAELADLLSLEAAQGEQLRQQLGRLGDDLRGTAAARDAAMQSLALLREERDRLAGERDGLRGERERLGARLSDLELAARSAADRAAATERQLAEALSRAERTGGDAARLQRDLRSSQTELAAAQAALEAMRREAQALDRQVRVERETVTQRLSEMARLSEQIRALTALRDELERRAAQEQRGRERAEAEAGERARLAESAAAQVALLTRQTEALRAELARLSRALDLAEAEGRDRNAQIALLGQRLNAALAARVEELQRYRSDFFGRLRDVLGERPEVRIVGDRFIFQGEVLFAPASAELSEAGLRQVRALATVLAEVTPLIPADVAWVLRVDGHADRNPIRSARFASNWELAAARAIAVAQRLIAEGLPPNRVAATSFGDAQPIDSGDSPQALARNRRIELRLTDR
ncbi:MAG: peptidoglycan -binding protein [Roseomonas sp.]|nr:peptidoglycan -binding protein [Roseomonas sp.]MCA3329107.1 peptidoglycan -binding protein [Roseomonas sp.]MCA3331394.1 peptidoglycan -binding protein [Roseomonas sp.]MCA3336867.1 peptidoglycan -binding protein [Roseomonas sp.]MCA3346124.1 peptidoglycan -binding protein [Roseomonas sp.]